MIRRVLSNLIFLIAGCSLTLLFIEGGYRLISNQGIKRATWSDRPTVYYKDSRAKTFQDYNQEKRKALNAFRIAAIGDSFTFGTQMQFYDTYPKQLERILNLNDGTQPVEVFNYGVPGASTYHEVATFRKARESEADLVILQITLNDPQKKAHTPTGISGRNDFGPYQPTGMMKKVGQYWRSLDYIAGRIHNTNTEKAYVNYYHKLFEDKETWKPFAKSIKKMAKRSENQEKGFCAVIFPLFGLPLNDDYPFFSIHRKIHKLLDDEGVPYMDLFDAYRGAPLNRIQLIPGVDFHPNEIGHRIAAEQIAVWLSEGGLIPATTFPKEQFNRRLDIRPINNGPLDHNLLRASQ